MTVHRSWKAWMAGAGVAAGLMLGVGSAQAHANVTWSVGIGVPGVVIGASSGAPAYYAPPVAPVYYTPAPLYRAPAPVYYVPPRVVYAPPVYYAPRPYWGGGPRHMHRRGPNWR